MSGVTTRCCHVRALILPSLQQAAVPVSGLMYPASREAKRLLLSLCKQVRQPVCRTTASPVACLQDSSIPFGLRRQAARILALISADPGACSSIQGSAWHRWLETAAKV